MTIHCSTVRRLASTRPAAGSALAALFAAASLATANAADAPAVAASAAGHRMVAPSLWPDGTFVPVWVDAYDTCLRREAAGREGRPAGSGLPVPDVVEAAAHACRLAVPAGALETERVQHERQLADAIATWRAAPAAVPFLADCDLASAQVPYPRGAAISEAEGVSVLLVWVDAQGQLTDVRVVKGSGPSYAHVLLDMAAEQTARRCRFSPASGVPSRIGRIDIGWRLQ